MIDKSKEPHLLLSNDHEPLINCAPKESPGGELMVSDEAVSILRSIFQSPCAEGFDAPVKAASVKFMITAQDEKELRELGYSQTEIDKIRPQDAADILKAAGKGTV
jgi:hypothetical protein